MGHSSKCEQQLDPGH